MSLYGTCALCGHEILEADSHDIHDQVTGWHTRKRRKGGGAHHKGKFWHATGAIAHGRCVDSAHSKQKAGIPVKQQGLF